MERNTNRSRTMAYIKAKKVKKTQHDEIKQTNLKKNEEMKKKTR